MKRHFYAGYVFRLATSIFALAVSCLGQLETRDSFSIDIPFAIAVGDVNHDGIADVVMVAGTNTEVFLGRGDGTFGAPKSYDVGTGSGPVAIADVNGDGNPDLIVVDENCPNSICDDSVSVVLGNGDGTFQDPMVFSTPPGPAGLVLGDFNNDGLLDIATINQGDYSTECDCIAVMFGNGDGTFQAPIITYPANGLPSAITAGHFGNSKNLDLAVAIGEESSGEVQTLFGNGDGTFSLGNEYSIAPDPSSIVSADLRDNHKTDLIVGEFEGTGVAVLLGNGDGTFQEPVVYEAGQPLGVAVGDINGDGIPDIVGATSTNAGFADVLLGNGNGTFKAAVSYPAGVFPRAVAIADFNGDHLPDVAIADQIGDAGIILLNTGAIRFSPTSPLNFRRQAVGTRSTARKVTITNTGKTMVTISSMKVSAQFGMTSTCSKVVIPNKSCTIDVTFSPTSQGPKSGTVTINDSASSKPQVIELSGTGT